MTREPVGLLKARLYITVAWSFLLGLLIAGLVVSVWGLRALMPVVVVVALTLVVVEGVVKERVP